VLVSTELAYFQSLANSTNPVARAAAAAGVLFLDYLDKIWLPRELWMSWSRFGRQEASKLLGIPVEGVIPTTNHLESFNGVLKNGHVQGLQRYGRRLRFDVFIFYLITRILPFIYA
jgi:hypothetical protein